MEAIQGYQTVEQQYRQRYKQRMERQFKIGEWPRLLLCGVEHDADRITVKPDASPEEVKAVVEDTQGGQVFQQAVRSPV
jgi:syntaxin 1B/2/3